MMDLFKELTELRKSILKMGAEVEQRLQQTIEALRRHDTETARQIKSRDHEIDRLELEIEEECLRILALSHPVAGDLRFVLAVMRINTNLERIGDMVKSIAKRVIDIEEHEPLEIPMAIDTMARETVQMFADALKALADEDGALARRVRHSDDRIDDLLKETFTWAQREIPSNTEHTEAAIDYVSIARKFERIADVSTNIAEDVIFLSEGSIVRHASEEAMRAADDDE